MLYIALIGGAMMGLILIADSLRTPLERQQILEKRFTSYSTALATDGCYWRTYNGSGQAITAIEILPNGKKNCQD